MLDIEVLVFEVLGSESVKSYWACGICLKHNNLLKVSKGAKIRNRYNQVLFV